jgi:hypothetical protein
MTRYSLLTFKLHYPKIVSKENQTPARDEQMARYSRKVSKNQDLDQILILLHCPHLRALVRSQLIRIKLFKSVDIGKTAGSSIYI